MSVSSKFSQLYLFKILFELVYSWESYHKNEKAELFMETKCTFRVYTVFDICSSRNHV